MLLNLGDGRFYSVENGLVTEFELDKTGKNIRIETRSDLSNFTVSLDVLRSIWVCLSEAADNKISETFHDL